MSIVDIAPDIAPGDNSTAAFDVERVRADFPILGETVYGKPLVYFDNAASAQKPRQVIEAMSEAYERYYSNVHRGVHHMSQRSTEAFEAGREKLAAHLNAASSEAINLVAASYGRAFLQAGDEVVISAMEHHSNLVPWHLLKEENGIVLKVAPIDEDGNFLLDDFEALLGPRTKLVAVTHISNALGTITPLKQIVSLAHARGIPVLADGCQAAPHLKIDVQDLDIDFYVVTGHKIYGPSGIGALYGKMDILKTMPPYQGGGEMIDVVTFEKSTFKAPPHRFEAGTPAIVEASGLGAAIDYVNRIGRRTKTASRPTRPSASPPSRACGCSAGRKRRPASSPSTSRARTRTMSAPSSTAAASRCAPDTIAPSP